MMIWRCNNGSQVIWNWIFIIAFTLLIFIGFIVGCILFDIFHFSLLLFNVGNIVLGLGRFLIVC
jgi:hypothetical protein